MEYEFQDRGHLDQDLEDWLSPRGSQSFHDFFSEENNQEYIQIKYQAPEGTIITNQDPQVGTSTMVIIKQ